MMLTAFSRQALAIRREQRDLPKQIWRQKTRLLRVSLAGHDQKGILVIKPSRCSCSGPS